MISYIFFDIDDCLFPSTEFSNLARKNAVRAMIRLGLQHDEETVYKLLLKIIEEKGSNFPNHFDLLLKRLKVNNPGKYIAAAVAAYHDTKASILPYPEVPDVILSLRENGAKIFVASDGIEIKQWDKLIRMGIGIFFDGVFVSENLKVSKDKSDFYRKILKQVKAKPEECLMVGDRENRDILPAKKIGMKTFRVLRGKYAENPKKTAADYSGKDLRKIVKMVKNISH